MVGTCMYTNIHPYSIFLSNCLQTAFKLACTAFMALHTMLVYRNQHFCTCRVHTRIYTIRMSVAGGQLSCSILAFSCTDIAVHGLTMYSSWHTLMYVFLKKRYRKADHLPQPFLGSTYLSEQCMHRIADSCTLELYVGPWRLYRQVWRQFEGSSSRKYCMDVCLCIYMFRPCIYLVHTLYRHVHTMYMGTTYFMHAPLSYTIPLQTRLYHLH